ncbi:MAG: hypothetical protein EBW13_06325, partial [Actinobacteria bacterium]|nr:hypothetical protein [Actinomycetota bacterium]
QPVFTVDLNGTTFGAQAGGHAVSACNNNNYSFTLAGVSAGTLPLVGSIRVWDGAIGTGTAGPMFTDTINSIGDLIYAATSGSVNAGTWSVEFLSVTDANGCSADLTGGSMNFTFNVSDPSATTINQSICAPNSYTFDGQTLTTSGTYMDTLTNAAGCDSVITLNLTVNQPSATTITQTICAPNSYSFNGQSYNATGTYTATLTNAAGCDSVITLNLTVVDVQITQEPSSSLSLVEGTTGSLSVTATGATTYEWQVLLSGTWTSLSNGATYSGATTSALGITAALSLNGFQYRVVVTGAAGCSDTSQTSTLTVTPALSRVIRIDALTACIGDTIDVPLEAEDFVGVSGLSLVIDYDGQSLSYQGYTSVGLNGGTLSVQGSATGSQVRLGW